jgi:aldehyde:ferredoxin oxidoreductase
MLERCYCLREGYNPAIHTRIPDRAFEQPITNKHGETFVLDREDFTRQVKDYNVNVLHLREDGLPRKDLLKELGLEYVFPTLDQLDLRWDPI